MKLLIVLIVSTQLFVSCEIFVSSKPSDKFSKQTDTVSIFYATSRAVDNPGPDVSKFYGSKRSRFMRYGVARVKHIISKRKSFHDIVGLKEMNSSGAEKYWDLLGSAIAEQKSREGKSRVLIHIHGYNNYFHEAVYTGATLSRSIGNQVIPCVFSWPTRGGLFTPGKLKRGYYHDKNQIDLAAQYLTNYIEEIKRRYPDVEIALVGHSMGCEVLMHSVEILHSKKVLDSIENIALFAADVDRAAFEIRYAKTLKKYSKMVSVYISEKDLALSVAKKIAGGYQRVGDAGANPVIIPGFDTIDVTAVDNDFLGHGYIRSNKFVANDLFYNIGRDDPARKRAGLHKEKHPSKKGYFWVFLRN